jgi:hypothetical protein
MNWTDSLVADYDVAVITTSAFIIITFSRTPDITVLNDLMLIQNKPGFRLSESSQSNSYNLNYPDTFTGNKVKAVIVNMLQSHNLRVKY